MQRRRYQRPSVQLWVGKSGEKFWKAEWRQYIAGRPKPKHRAMTWPCSRYTKGEAQEAADKLIRGETEGPARPDGSVTVREFWEQVFFPVRRKRVAPNTQQTYETAWRTHVEPVLGSLKLQDVRKHAVDTVLDRIADAGKSKQTARVALVIMRELFAEAAENGNISENPSRGRDSGHPLPPAQTRAGAASAQNVLEHILCDMWRPEICGGQQITLLQ